MPLFMCNWIDLQALEFFCKVKKTQHQNPEFGPKPSEIPKKKKLAKRKVY